MDKASGTMKGFQRRLKNLLETNYSHSHLVLDVGQDTESVMLNAEAVTDSSGLSNVHCTHCSMKEKQTKLWHTPYYDNELKLKQLYIKICKNLPAYGCKLYQVKELLGTNNKKKVKFLHPELKIRAKTFF